jgi:hypothetical protein
MAPAQQHQGQAKREGRGTQGAIQNLDIQNIMFHLMKVVLDSQPVPCHLA